MRFLRGKLWCEGLDHHPTKLMITSLVRRSTVGNVRAPRGWNAFSAVTHWNEQALLRSQSGPMAGMALSASPSNFLTSIEPHLDATLVSPLHFDAQVLLTQMELFLHWLGAGEGAHQP